MRELISAVLIISVLCGIGTVIYNAQSFKGILGYFLMGTIIAMGLTCALLLFAIAILLAAVGVVELAT